MRRFLWVMAGVFVFGGVALAADKPNPDQLKKAYDDALVQLKDAQNSKNELAKQNDNLAKQIEELRKQLASANAQIQGLRRQVADNDEKTFYLRSYYAAWRAFLRTHPDLAVRWKLFLGSDPLALPQEPLPLVDPGIPLPPELQAESARG